MFFQMWEDSITEWMSGVQQSNWRLWRKRYSWDRFRIIKVASRNKCACSGERYMVWLQYRRLFSCTFDLALSSLSSPSSRYSLWRGGSLERYSSVIRTYNPYWTGTFICSVEISRFLHFSNRHLSQLSRSWFCCNPHTSTHSPSQTHTHIVTYMWGATRSHELRDVTVSRRKIGYRNSFLT